jgi:alpha-D-ribose 1-methylphosphonate 5-phosphate C-P lyase
MAFSQGAQDISNAVSIRDILWLEVEGLAAIFGDQ